MDKYICDAACGLCQTLPKPYCDCKCYFAGTCVTM